MTNEPVSFIEWRNQSDELNMIKAENVTVLNYTIELVTDDMQGQMYTCRAVVRNITDTETVTLRVEGV